jgi:hypothetical protein
MFEHYFAALLRRMQAQDLAHSALPDAPAQPAPADPAWEAEHGWLYC